jgi:hypothetical protein
LSFTKELQYDSYSFEAYQRALPLCVFFGTCARHSCQSQRSPQNSTVALASGARAPADQSLYVNGSVSLFSPDQESWLRLVDVGYLEVHTTKTTIAQNVDRVTGTVNDMVWSASLGKTLNASADAYLEMDVSALQQFNMYFITVRTCMTYNLTLCCYVLQASGTLLWKDLKGALGPVLWSSYTNVPGSVLKVNDDASFSVHDGITDRLYYTSSNSLSWNQTRAAPFSMFSPSKQFELALEIDGNLLIRDVLQAPPKTIWQTNKRRAQSTTDMYLWMSVSVLCCISFTCNTIHCVTYPLCGKL